MVSLYLNRGGLGDCVHLSENIVLLTFSLLYYLIQKQICCSQSKGIDCYVAWFPHHLESI